MAAPLFDNIPSEPKDRDQWVLWKTINRAGKRTKVPYQPSGNEADSTDPGTWSRYSDVVDAYNKGGYDGIGYVFDTLDPYAGVDLDHCINEDGSMLPKAKAILDKLNSYSEISPSGKGVKVFLRAKNPVSIRKKDGKFQQGFESKKPGILEIEIYYGYRFFTLTGNKLPDYPATVEDRNQELTDIFKEVFNSRNYFNGEANSEKGPDPQERASGAGAISPDGNNRYLELLNADHSFYKEFITPAPAGTRSDVEFNLCARLWEAGIDKNDIYIIMNSSPQTKWQERDDSYRWETIRKAVAASEASHKEREEEDAKREAAKKTAPLTIEDVADIEYDENGKIKAVHFSPTLAAGEILSRLPLAMSEDSVDIYRFAGQIYKPDGARRIDRTLCVVAGDQFTAHALREVIRRIKNELLEKPVIFEPDPYILAVKNGVADLLTGEVREYRAEDLILDQIPVSFDPAARCPAFIAFLESITPNVSDRITLIDWFVATAIKEPLAYVLFLLGLGRNGKGIYEKLIKKFFGKAAFRDLPLAEVGKNNFAASGFYRKRGWIASETGKRKAGIGTDFIKLTSGNGSIDGDRKNQSRIQFEPYFQTIVDTNTMPTIKDGSVGWQERFVKANLPFIFLANPDPKNPLEKMRDPALFEKLSTSGELSGILNLLLFRSKAIGKSCTIHKRSGAEMFAEYAEQSSSVTAFVEMFCEYDDALSGLWTPSEPIYEAYREWCSYKVGEVVDIRYFGKQLTKFCGPGGASKQGKDKDRNNIRLYKGLVFDSVKCKTTLAALQKAISPVVFNSLYVSSSFLHEEEEKKSQKISMSSLSSSNSMWNEIIEKFGNSSKEKNSPIKKECSNLTKTMKTMKTSAARDPVGSGPHEDTTKTNQEMMKTEPTIGPNPRRDEPTPTKAVRVKTDYRSDYSGSMRTFKEGEILRIGVDISAVRAELWLKRGVVEEAQA